MSTEPSAPADQSASGEPATLFPTVFEFEYGKYTNADDLARDIQNPTHDRYAIVCKLHNAMADGSIRTWTSWDSPLLP